MLECLLMLVNICYIISRYTFPEKAVLFVFADLSRKRFLASLKPLFLRWSAKTKMNLFKNCFEV